MIQERVHAGLARARAEGKVLGRPTVGDEKETEVRDCLELGWGLVKSGRYVGRPAGPAQQKGAVSWMLAD
jgi:DNA invertase Pin-like site-specific DNA recombinase